MTGGAPSAPLRATARIRAQRTVSVSGLRRLELELPRPIVFAPGQFAMLNLTDARARPFGRPFSLLDAAGSTVSILYRIVGGGTADLAAAREGDGVSWLGPLGRPFAPPSGGAPRLLLAGGVGLPPLVAWWARHGSTRDLACFGARDPDDVPWELLDAAWGVAVDAPGPLPPGRTATLGTVVALAQATLDATASPGEAHQLLACGPLPMLRAAVTLATERGWPCLVSVEEHMGCGYGVCRGCVVPRRGGGWLTACQDGPVLEAAQIDWEAFGRPVSLPPGAAAPAGCCGHDAAEARP